MADDVQRGHKIRPIQGMSGHTVSCGFFHQIGTGELACIWCGIGELIVGNDKDKREFFHRREVDSLVESAGGGATVADAGRAHADRAALHTPGQ